MATKQPRVVAAMAPATSDAPPAPKKPGKAKPDPTVQPAPEVGAAAPAFTLTADDGAQISLADLAGNTVVLYFYPRDNTPGCTVEACGFRDKHAEIEAQGAVVLGVSTDSVRTHAGFRGKFQLPFSLLSDPGADVIAAYGSWGEKQFMGKRYMGIIRTTVLIDQDGKVKKVYGKVSPKTHAGEVLADLSGG